MQTIFRQALGTVIGGLIVAAIFLVPRAFAQDTVMVAAAQSPTMVDTGDVTNQLSYQGVLLTPGGQPVVDKSYNMTFRLWDASVGGTERARADQSVNTTNGMFSTLITFSGDLETLLTGPDYWIGVTVAPDTAEMTPRQKLAYVPYAIWSRNSDQIDGKGSSWLPVAFGVVDRNGGFIQNRGFDSANAAGDNVYEIRITGINYNLNDFVTQVTPVNAGGDNSCPTPTSALTSSSDDRLLVEMYDRNGNRVRCRFHVIVWRP